MFQAEKGENKQSIKTIVLKTYKLKKSENKQQVTPKEIRRKKSIKIKAENINF